MSGNEALVQLRSRGHTLPVIAVTANSMSEDINKCLQIGFTGFLSKPCRKEIVRSMVKQYARTNTDPAHQPPSPPSPPTRNMRLVASSFSHAAGEGGSLVPSSTGHLPSSASASSLGVPVRRRGDSHPPVPMPGSPTQ